MFAVPEVERKAPTTVAERDAPVLRGRSASVPLGRLLLQVLGLGLDPVLREEAIRDDVVGTGGAVRTVKSS